MRNSTQFCFLFACSAALLSCGCGGSAGKPGTVPVAGTVTFEGKPLAGAKVYFMTESHSALAVTDEEGHFELAQGAKPGENRIYVTKIEGADAAGAEEDMDVEQMRAAAGGGAEGMPAEIKELLPAKYSDPQQTELTVQVPEDGMDDANFDL